ncbi:MAG TPA: response regulator, partial [Spirochaetota bacterium]|nr:response regulator [Spirochaetota bacterium]
MIYKKNAKIVVIDDEKDTCELLRDIFEQENFNVMFYTDSQKFVNDLPNYNYDNLDLVIVDLMMPKVDGFQVMNLLNSKETTRYIPKMVISAFQSKDNLKDAYNYGAIQFIEKPFSI